MLYAKYCILFYSFSHSVGTLSTATDSGLIQIQPGPLKGYAEVSVNCLTQNPKSCLAPNESLCVRKGSSLGKH